MKMIRRTEMIVSSGILRNPVKRPKGSGFLAACVLVLTGCPLVAGQTTMAINDHAEVAPGTALPAASSLMFPDYIISPDDILMISVFDAPDITGEYRVSPAGQIELPLLSAPIVAAGRTPAQLS
jgi:protein involved in polysaccharide export with SLBB domain